MDNRFSVRRVSSSTNPPMEDVPETEELKVNVNPAGYVNHAYTTDQPDYNTDRKKSFVHLTLEALPRVDNYRNGIEAIKRPSLGELHGEEKDFKDGLDIDAKDHDSSPGHGIKLGWIQGVLIPCLLNIWGVMLFLRLAWVVGQAGIGHTLLIIGISAVVCVITTTSMSAISTNGEVKGGGIYYIISRSLGPEFGASVGVVFAFANAVAASMNTIGFCNSMNDLLRENGVKIIDGATNDVRIVGVVAIFIMILVCAVGMEWESKAQNFLIVIIVGAIIDFIAGCIYGPQEDLQIARGFSGLNTTLFERNWGPDYHFSEGMDQTFFSVFAIFFPSVTGIQAGANISGDLKDPASAIPKGTMLSLLISMISYAVFVFFAGSSAYRAATGSISDLANGTFADCGGRNCEYGLSNSYTIMQMMSLWAPFIYAGCFAATLSTALTNLLSVPRIIQALGIDRIYPGLIFFSKGYGKANEPYRGYVLTFIVSVAFLLIAELNAIAPLISNFYLASYALINFCAFHAALIKPLGWRPTYKYYNMWLSLSGFFLCVAIMFLIDWSTSLITFFVIFALYLIVVYRKPDVNWGSSTQAQTYKTALSSTIRLTNISDHVKNYHPQVLVLCGKPCARPTLLDLGNLITKNNSVLICGDILAKKASYKSRQRRLKSGYSWLKDRKIKGFYSVVDNANLEEGSKCFLQAAGIGKLIPNVLLLGFKNNWFACPPTELLAYFDTLHEAFNNRVAVVILRVPGGLDYSAITDEDEVSASNADLTQNFTIPKIEHSDSTFSFSNIKHTDSTNSLNFLPVDSPQLGRKYNVADKSDNPKDILKSHKKKAFEEQLKEVTLTKTGQELPPKILQELTLFSRKQEKGMIDVWWLYDDGGFTILLPYIISTRSSWTNCELRVFALTNRKHELELEERNMASLLSKFRIDYKSLKMVEDITTKPKEETQEFFNDLINNFRKSSEEIEDKEYKVTVEELSALQEKTNRHLRLRELLLEHSKEASLIVMSLPMPRKGMVSAPLYMAWLETVTKDMPPITLVRGNQSSVLTFYS